jgi:propanediol dehydratase small subunit
MKNLFFDDQLNVTNQSSKVLAVDHLSVGDMTKKEMLVCHLTMEVVRVTKTTIRRKAHANIIVRNPELAKVSTFYATV